MDNQRNYESHWLRTAHEIIPDIIYAPGFPIDRVTRDLATRDTSTWEQQRQEYTRSRLARRDTTLTTAWPTVPTRPARATATPSVVVPSLVPAGNPLDILMRALTVDLGAEPDFARWLDTSIPIRATAAELGANTTISNATEEADCTICQDRITTGQQTRKLNHCGHTFHRVCIDPWLSTHVTCPMCRHDLRNVVERAPGT